MIICYKNGRCLTHAIMRGKERVILSLKINVGPTFMKELFFVDVELCSVEIGTLQWHKYEVSLLMLKQSKVKEKGGKNKKRARAPKRFVFLG